LTGFRDAIGEAIVRDLDAGWHLEWGGGLPWVAVAESRDGGAAAMRAAIREADGRGAGHATSIRGLPVLRQAVPMFEPQLIALAALAVRIKESFDPRRVPNPGRMVEGW